MKNKDNIEFYKECLTDSVAYNYYILMKKKIIKFIKTLKPNKIYLHYNLTYGSVRAEADIMIIGKEKNYLLEIKASKYVVATLSNVTQTMLYNFLLDKRDIKVNDIYLINLLDGSCCYFYHNNLKK